MSSKQKNRNNCSAKTGASSLIKPQQSKNLSLALPNENSLVSNIEYSNNSLNIRYDSSTCMRDSFQLLKSNMPSFERFRPRQEFSRQQGGQKQRTLSTLRAFLFYMSGGDVVSLLATFFNGIEGKKICRQLGSIMSASKLDALMVSISKSYNSGNDGQSLRLVANHFTLKELQQWGWSVSDKTLAKARRPLQFKKTPPNCHPLSVETKELVRKFYEENSQPAGNRTCYDKNTKTHVPVVCNISTIKKLHQDFTQKFPRQQISYSSFLALKPQNMRPSKRKIDMCEYCVNAEKIFAKRARTATQFPLGLEASERNLIQPSILDKNASNITQNVAQVSNASENPALTRTSMEGASVRGNYSTKVRHFSNMLVRTPGSKTKIGKLHTLTPTSIRNENDDRNIVLYEMHKKIFENQRRIFNFHKSSKEAGEITIVGDFKQNFVVGGIGPVEIGNDFFSRTQVSCLGFAVYVGGTDDSGKPISPKYYDFLSYILSHNTLYVKDCVDILLRKLSTNVEIKKIHFWFDSGRHFRNAELCHHLISSPFLENIQFDLNFFAEHHGKSPVDAHFSQLSNLMKQEAKRRMINNIEDLEEIFQKKYNVVIYERKTIQKNGSKIQLTSTQGKIILGDYYSIGADKEKKVFVSVLSESSQKIWCKYSTKKFVDSRSVKLPPNLTQIQNNSTAKTEIFSNIVASRLQRQHKLMDLGTKKKITKIIR